MSAAMTSRSASSLRTAALIFFFYRPDADRVDVLLQEMNDLIAESVCGFLLRLSAYAHLISHSNCSGITMQLSEDSSHALVQLGELQHG